MDEPSIACSPPEDVRLDSWATLRISGADAEAFLQGQLSADVGAIRDGQAGWASYNNPKGRMLVVMRVHRAAQGFCLAMPADLIAPIGKRLKMFVLRSKVSLDPVDAADTAAQMADRRALIEAGVPVVYAETQDRWVAQMANLDLIGGISFDKGCYTGQEVVARLHYLGNLKKRMFKLQGRGAVPPPGTAIRDEGGDQQAVGDVVDAVADGNDGFVASAVLQLSHARSTRLRLDHDPHTTAVQALRYPYLPSTEG
jgi:folate-binding protein YgfZ